MNAIVIVDLQKGFVKEEYAHIPKAIKDHLEASDYDHVLMGAFKNAHESNFVRLLNWNKLFTAPETDIVPELSAYADPSRVFWRTAYSLFKNPDFEAYLMKHEIQSFDLCGLVADSCVLATAFDGFDKGYEVRVLHDLMRTKEGLNHATCEIFERNIDPVPKRAK
jgi:nicotinamidase-related amidase